MRLEGSPDPWRLALKLYGGGGPLTCGLDDSRVLDSVMGIVEEEASKIGFEARRFHMPALSWRPLEAYCEPCGELTIAPYVEEGDVEGGVEWLAGDPSDPVSWRRYGGSPIVVVEEPAEPDETAKAALLASEAGAAALLVCPRTAPRTIVSTGSWGFSFTTGAPAPLLVGYVPGSACRVLRASRRARVYARARTIETVSEGLEVTFSGGRGRPWLFGAHWDRWPGGFQDDTLGVAQAVAASIAAAENGVRARLLLFPCEEHGAPGYASWYWAWGSRFYATQLHRAGLEGEVAGYINFDMAGSRPLVVSGSPPLLAPLPRGSWRARLWECPECDSLQLAVHAGVPTLSIHTLRTPRTLQVYHTSLDTPENADPSVSRLAVEIAVRAVLGGPRWEYMDHLVAGILGQGPLEARRLAVLILGAASRVGWERLYPPLARIGLRPVDYGSRRWTRGPLEAHWFPEASLLPRLLSDVRRGRDPGEVWVAGWEYPLYHTRPSPGARGCGASCIMAQARLALEALRDRVEEVLRGLLA